MSFFLILDFNGKTAWQLSALFSTNFLKIVRHSISDFTSAKSYFWTANLTLDLSNWKSIRSKAKSWNGFFPFPFHVPKSTLNCSWLQNRKTMRFAMDWAERSRKNERFLLRLNRNNDSQSEWSTIFALLRMTKLALRLIWSLKLKLGKKLHKAGKDFGS